MTKKISLPLLLAAIAVAAPSQADELPSPTLIGSHLQSSDNSQVADSTPAQSEASPNAPQLDEAQATSTPPTGNALPAQPQPVQTPHLGNITPEARAQQGSPFSAPTPASPTAYVAPRKAPMIEVHDGSPAAQIEAATAQPAASDRAAANERAQDPFVQAMAQVYANNPVIKAQRKALEAIDEGVNQAFSGMLPTANAEYDTGRARTAVAHQKWNYGNETDKGLTVTQDIFHGGETYSSFKAAKDRVKAGQAQLTSVEQQVLYNAVVAYTDVVEKQLVLDVNRNNVDVLTKQLDATSARFKVGDITRTDVAQAEARLAAARAGERQAQGDLESSRATYKRLIGAMPADKLELPPVPAGLPETLAQADEQALAAHPDLQASQHLEKAAQKDVDTRTGALLPDVALQGSMLRSNSPSSISGLNSQVDDDALMLNVSIPLYQGGGEYSRIREAQDIAQQAKFNSFDTRDAVIENVDRSWQDYQTAKAVIVSSEESLHAADVALEGITQENQSGLRTILDVLDTEQNDFTARLQLVQAQRAEKTQAYRLLAAIGRLTAKDLALPVTLHDPKEHYDNVKYQLMGWE